MFKTISIMSVFLITLAIAQLSEGAKPACGACASAVWSKAVDEATTKALETAQAVYTTPIHVTLKQDGNEYIYYSAHKNTIRFTGKRGEEIALGGGAARVDNMAKLEGVEGIYLNAAYYEEADGVPYHAVIIKYKN